MARGILSLDTSRKAEQMQIQLWREMSSISKAQAVSALTRSVLQLSLTGFRQRRPEATDLERKVHLARLLLGPELAQQVHPESAELHG